MKILHFSDLHLDSPFASSTMPPKIAQGCRLRLRRTLVKILDLAVEYEVDAVTIGGDLFEGDRVSKDTIQFLLESFAQLAPIPILIAPGNHDYYNPVSPYARYEWPDNVYIFSEYKPRPVTLMNDVLIWGVANTLPNCRDNPLTDFRAHPEGMKHVLLLHGSEMGHFDESRGEYAPFRIQDLERAGIQFALLGHYHAGRIIENNGPVAVYPGSPQPLSFGETGKHTAVLLDWQDTKPNITMIPLATQAFITLDFKPEPITDTHSLAESIISAISTRATEANFLRVNLIGEEPESLNLQLGLLEAHLSQYFDYVTIHNRMSKAEVKLVQLDEKTVRGRFARRLKHMLEEEPEDPALIEMALKFGLAAFEEENILDS